MNESISLTYIQLKHEDLPVRRVYRIDGKNYTFEFNYNSVGDFYSLMILGDDENPIYSSKLTYLENTLQEFVEGLDLKRKLIPLNLSDVMQDRANIDRISIDNFDSMRLCII